MPKLNLLIMAGKNKGICIMVCLVFYIAIPWVNSQEIERKKLKEKISAFELNHPLGTKDTTYILLYSKLAQSFNFINSDSLYHYSKIVYALSDSANFENGKILALCSLGDHSSNIGNSKKAIEHYNKALHLAQAKKYKKVWGKLYNSLANQFLFKGNYSKALEHYLNGIDAAKTIEDFEMLSILNENIAGMYAEQKDFEQALEFYKKVKKINQKLNDEIISAETMSNMASLYADVEDFDQAMFNINHSIATFEKHKISDWLAFAYGVKGKIYLKQEKFDWALYWYDKADFIYEKLDDKRGAIEVYDGYSKAFYGVEEDSLAENLALKGNVIAKEIGALDFQKNTSETLYKIYKKKGDFENAIVYLEAFEALSDSLAKDEIKNNLTLYKTKESHNRQKELIIAENEKQLARQRYYMYAAIVVLIVLLSTSIPLYINQKKLVKLYKVHKEKTKTLSEREEELKRIDKTKNQLFSIIGHDLRGPIGGLQGLLRLFANNDIPQSEFISFIPKLRADVDHILFSLNNLLSWGQAQMKNDITKPGIIPVKNHVDDSIRLLAENAKAKSIKISNMVPEMASVWVDSNQLDIIIRNLISNAIKFTPENGSITINALKVHDSWKIQVRDTGVGMTEKIKNSIFASDSSVTTFGTNNEKGTGLGLSLCKEMVERNNGKIWVESELNKGTSFYFTIPKVDREKFKQAS